MGSESTSSVQVTYSVHIHDEGSDGMWAEVAELPGCFASGRNVKELMEGLAEAISLYLSTDTSPVEARLTKRAPISGERVEEQKYLVSH